MPAYKYVSARLGTDRAVEGWYCIDGNSVDVFTHHRHERTPGGSTLYIEPGEHIRSIELHGEDPRTVAIRTLRGHSWAERRDIHRKLDYGPSGIY